MKLETAIKQIQKEADFLGMDIHRVLQFIDRSPLAFPKKTVQASEVLKTIKLL